MASKKNNQSRAASAKAGTGKASKKKNKKKFKLPKISEFKDPEPIKPSAYVICVIQLVVVFALWFWVAFRYFTSDSQWAPLAIAIMFFVGVLSMYFTRAAVESKRRYGKVNGQTLLYYSQMIKSDQKWSLWIGLSFFAVFWVASWIFRSPNIDMTTIYIATAFYLGYFWTCKYKGEENLPFGWMETIFLLVVNVTNYIVYFLG